MYNITTNAKSYNVPNILELTAVINAKGWSKRSVITTIDGKTADSNMIEVITSIIDAEKTYKILGKGFTGEQIIGNIEGYAKEHSNLFKKCPIVVDGRHRTIALLLLAVFGGKTLEPKIVRVNEADAKVEALEGNVEQDFITRLQVASKLAQAVELMKQGVYQRESDLPFKRGMNQKIFAQAQLVYVHNVSIEDALKLDKEAARKASAEKDVKAAVKTALAGKTNVKKVISGAKLRELSARALTVDPKATNAITQLLFAIVEDQETSAIKIIVDNLGGEVKTA